MDTIPLQNREKVDAVIVGAGAAGSLYAAKLAEAGKQVVVLEAGPAWELGDMISSQIWARRLKWRGDAVMFKGKHSFAHNHGTGSGFGGAALHHFGTWPRFSEEAFELRSRFDAEMDWPIRYDDLRPYYDSVQREVGISGDAEQESWRPPGEAYPMPGLPRFKQAELLAKGFEALNKPIAPLPAIVNTTVYDGRPPCLYDGWCEAGCPIGALGNPMFNYFKQAGAAGADLRSDCQVTRVLTDAKGRALGVEYYHNGERKAQYADVVILAASFVQNPRLLLNSVSPQHPQGLGNANGLVGAYITPDILALLYGMFEEETENHRGINAGVMMSRGSFREQGRPDGAYQWQIAPSLKPNDLLGIANARAHLFGKPLDDFMHRATKHLATMAGFAGAKAVKENRIELTGRKDRFGMPLAQVQHSFHPESLALWEYLKDEGKKVMAAAGAKEVWTGPMASGHIIGGTIMGADPAASVTDSYGRLHDVPNVVISGAGLFPAGSGYSPTYTIHAVAARSAARMVANWGEFAA